jgi:hypothetical protein
LIDPKSLSLIGDWDAIDTTTLDLGSELMVVHNDWKAYQLLSLKQNWNSGGSSLAKVNAVEEVKQFVDQNGFVGTWGLVRFPLHAFVYSRLLIEGDQPCPSVLPIAYSDLIFPRKINGVSYLGTVRLSGGKSVQLAGSGTGQVDVRWFLKGAGRLLEETVVGEAIVSGEMVGIAAGPLPESPYEAEFCRAIQGSERADSWHKRPLISQASRYPGSFFQGEGSIHTSSFTSDTSIEIKSTHPKAEIVVLIPVPDQTR